MLVSSQKLILVFLSFVLGLAMLLSRRLLLYGRGADLVAEERTYFEGMAPGRGEPALPAADCPKAPNLQRLGSWEEWIRWEGELSLSPW